MSANSFGRIFRITTFGESHGHAIGVVIDGVPPRLALDLGAVQVEMDRRKPGQSSVTTPRAEDDIVHVFSGLYEGKTTGAPLAMVIFNKDQRSKDYSAIAEVFRPGHADYTWYTKYGIRDPRGGGRSSGRETAARVAAGAVAKQILAPLGVKITGHVTRVADIVAEKFDAGVIEQNPVRCADGDAAKRMAAAIEAAKAAGDSLGAVVEVIAEGVPVGWGDPIYEKLEARLAFGLMSIGAIKGVEIGDGFGSALLRGSESNDAMGADGFATNHAGGIQGGISNGAPIVARIAVKPTSSISREQRTVDTEGRAREIRIEGRHDPCIAPRVVPVAEAMVALVLVDAYLASRAMAPQ
ncbi:MAG: chorismate synthase [Deltaproteobacteria bacterium]|nr:chorismate synthase [Deltaproteobacteria bacterium]